MQRYFLFCFIVSLVFQGIVCYKVDQQNNDSPEDESLNQEHSLESIETPKELVDEVLLKNQAKRPTFKFTRTGTRVIDCVPQKIQDCKHLYVDGELKKVCTTVGYTVCN